jgi:transcriptional regulator with XRE-family HTH domain
MNVRTLGVRLARQRLEAGLTQAELAGLMGTTQSALSRVESGTVVPTLDMIDRYARALGRPLTIVFGSSDAAPRREVLEERVRRVLGDYVFDPWERNPTDSEARSLIADGLTRESFERRKASSAGKARA